MRVTHICDFERGRLGSYTLDSIRALLTQESERERR